MVTEEDDRVLGLSLSAEGLGFFSKNSSEGRFVFGALVKFEELVPGFDFGFGLSNFLIGAGQIFQEFGLLLCVLGLLEGLLPSDDRTGIVSNLKLLRGFVLWGNPLSVDGST